MEINYKDLILEINKIHKQRRKLNIREEKLNKKISQLKDNNS